MPALALLLALPVCTAEATAQAVLLTPGGDSAGAARPIPESVAARRAAELAAAVESGSAAAIRAFVENSFAPGSPAAAASRFDWIARIRHHTGGMEPLSVRATGPREVEILVRNRVTGWRDRMVLLLEPQPPHRFRNVALRSPEPPTALLDGALSDGRLAREAESVVSALGRTGAFSGAVLLARNDTILFQAAHGEANRDFGVPNRLDTRFGLGSMNKMFTAVAIAQLVEAGRLSFDDPLSKFLPDHFAAGAADRIRIRHLLSHTSGLGNFFTREYMESSRARFRTIDDLLALTRGDSLAFEPGTRWQYSNTGFLVLGRVIELVSGQSYHDYVREHIYRPAGMRHTGEFDLDQANPQLAVGYERTYTDEGIRYRNNLFDVGIRGGPAGGGYSTVGDLHRFARALLGGRLVSPAMLDTLITPKPELGSPVYGFGFRRYPDGSVGHGGEFPGVSSQLAMAPATGRVLVVLSNVGDDGVGSFQVAALRKLLVR